MITFANSLDPDQAQQMVPVFLKEFFEVNFEKSAYDNKSMKNYPACFFEFCSQLNLGWKRCLQNVHQHFSFLSTIQQIVYNSAVADPEGVRLNY